MSLLSTDIAKVKRLSLREVKLPTTERKVEPITPILVEKPPTDEELGTMRRNNINTNLIINDMKNLASILMILLITSLFFYSCKNGKNNKEQAKVTNNGKIMVENGKGKKDTINYQCVGCEENIRDTALFNKVIKEASLRTKNRLNYPLSFIPKKVELTIIKEDSLFYFENNKKIENTLLVIAKYDYIAKNGYGNELEGDAISSFYIKDNKIADLDEEIKLDSLKFDGKNISRNLTLYSSYDNSFIEIIPTKDKSLIVLTSLSCVDEGAWLLITFENDEEIKLVSWNDFNCEGRSYFHQFNSNQVRKLKENKIKSVSLVDKKSVSCLVPKNKSDYFIQLMNLYSNN